MPRLIGGSLPAGPAMLAVFESSFPIFLLIFVGMALRRTPLVDEAGWPGMEQLTYWFLYPALLFVTVLNADFTGLALDRMLVSLLLGLGAMIALSLAMWWPVRTLGLASAREFGSMFQSSIRWNGFMALAIAQSLFGSAGAAVVALVMAVIIVPINVASVSVLSFFSGRDLALGKVLRQIAINPFIISIVLALMLRMTPGGLYGPLNETLTLVGSAALGLGLISIGAGLRPGDLLSARATMWLPVFVKLILFPAVLVAIALSFGVTGDQLLYLTLCAAVPTAMNGYLLARQLGSDAELYAAITTIQTGLSFFTIPAVLAVTAQLTSG